MATDRHTAPPAPGSDARLQTTDRDARTQLLAPDAARAAVTREVASWEGVSVHEHRAIGTAFRVGRRELGHLHGSIADLPVPRRLRDQLIAIGRARPHHAVPDSGWITAPMRSSSDIASLIELFRWNYERSWPDLAQGDG